ncbi:RNA polymerase sigma-70 factor [Reichenbachiella carrageenanivorans]|uniref:RNA polymerase sigma-70 factor n=1 Tax=Reichenbachiella carrageenanivorans TaxID=2979869 RepID=A0ABY6CZV0_9BACT|nr:RNA polymerase sigma-70 factor [Reichenbachiella carrageenanivorans]UXX79224.1 RNA polymerase sigma-70 factor [Reichenbachiella carrageenanivorans]
MDIAINITDLSNQSTFEKVFKTYYQQLAAFAYQYVACHDTAEEIVQEVFANVWSKSDQIEIRTAVKSYLYGAVRNACLNHIKHKKVVRQHEVYEGRKPEGYESNFLELDELQGEIDAALDQLPDKCRQIFEMSRFEEKKYKEIAEELGLSIKTVENQMGRALKVMRAALSKHIPSLVFWIITIVQKNLWG